MSPPVVEINHWANLATTDIIGMAAMGKDFESLQQGQDHPLIANFEEITNPSTEKVIYFALNILGLSKIVLLLPWRMNKLAGTISTNLYDICSSLIDQKRSELTTTEPDSHKDILSQSHDDNFPQPQAAGRSIPHNSLCWPWNDFYDLHMDDLPACSESRNPA